MTIVCESSLYFVFYICILYFVFCILYLYFVFVKGNENDNQSKHGRLWQLTDWGCATLARVCLSTDSFDLIYLYLYLYLSYIFAFVFIFVKLFIVKKKILTDCATLAGVCLSTSLDHKATIYLCLGLLLVFLFIATLL